MLGLPLNWRLELSRAVLDPETCYYQLEVRTVPPAKAFARVLFLSPDRRFLTVGVYDPARRTPGLLQVAPMRNEGYIETPGYGPSRPAVTGDLMLLLSAKSMALRGGRVYFDAIVQLGVSVHGAASANAVVSYDAPVVKPASIRLKSMLGYTSAPLKVAWPEGSKRVKFRVETADDNATAGTVTVTARVFFLDAEGKPWRLDLDDRQLKSVTIQVGPK
jgi:hypothetical protein